ncbi:MAG: ATP-binding protein [Oscillospiraceae bacterium]|nr:ATP-binding protein [Oscillospiraceae bacterium]
MTPEGYRPRLIDAHISRLMSIYGAVCVEGPKWCGKTWTSRNHSESAVFIGDPAGNFMNRQLAEMDASLVLEGKSPRLIDEWQVVPAIWDAVRYKVDQTGNKGQYVLTGSSTPVMKGKLHGGSGRIGRIAMRTMSLYETGHSTGIVSIMDLFNDSLSAAPVPEVQLDELISYVVRGGWPGIQDLPQRDALQIPKDYLQNIPDDMERSDGKKRDVKKVAALLRALGRAESNMTSKKALQKDIEEFAEDRENMSEVSFDTITDYLDCFSRLFLTEDQPAFENKLRSSIKALKKPKRHFTDPSLAAAAIGATPEMLKNDLNTFGYLFEALCVRDLRIYSACYDGKVYHYHDERDNEVDAVVELPDGRWGLFEIKVGFHQVEAAAQELLRLRTKFKAETDSDASFLCVLCGMSNAAFKRPDGVFVVPITALGI